MNYKINSENSPLVSVCMITYNHEKYIVQAIEGVLMQKTDFPIELVIGEDRSTDNTRNICLEYKEKYPDQIKLLLPENNLGMLGNFITTLHACTGKYIAFCEGDDYWTDPYKLQKHVDFLEADNNQDYSLVYTDVDIYYEDTKKRQSAIIRNGLSLIDGANPIKSKGYLANLTWLFRKTALQLFTLENNCVDAAAFMFFEIAQQTKVHYIPEVTGTYRKHFGSASHHKAQQDRLEFAFKSFFIKFNYVIKYNIDKNIAYPILFEEVVFLLEKTMELNMESNTEFLISSLIQHNLMQEFIKYMLFQKQQMDWKIMRIRSSIVFRFGRFLFKCFPFLKRLKNSIKDSYSNKKTYTPENVIHS